MPRYKMVNGERIQFTAAEETARDAEEAAWADGALARAQADLRAKRNRLLAETTGTVMRARRCITSPGNLMVARRSYRLRFQSIQGTMPIRWQAAY